jgi:predicted MPP superfamily phosphohydrolase
VALAWCFASVLAFLLLTLWRRVPRFSQERRGFISAAGAALAAAPFVAMTYGILAERKQLRLREVDVPIPNLPQDLAGLRIVQLSDIHLSAFLSERELERAVDMANGLRANLALVTGDLISNYGDPLDVCLRQIARLRADAGTLGCLGNHEIYAQVEDEATRKAARLGIEFLRQESRLLRFGNAALNIFGVDYQRKGGRYLEGAGRWIAPGVTNVLLSHNPDVFDVAARQGWDLSISGHTHGGQVTLEILHQELSFSRFFTRYVYGLYRQGPSSIWVTRGIGTVGLPARIGAPPEVALIRLCAT